MKWMFFKYFRLFNQTFYRQRALLSLCQASVGAKKYFMSLSLRSIALNILHNLFNFEQDCLKVEKDFLRVFNYMFESLHL